MEKLKFRITNINVMYEDDDISRVEVHFNTEDPNRYMSLTGYVPLTKEEYETNPTISGLVDIVKLKVLDKINPED